MPYVELQIDPIRQARRQSRCKCAIGKDGRKADTERGHAEGWCCCLRHRYRKIPVPLKRKGHGAGLSSADCQSRSCRTPTAGGHGLQGGCKKYRRAGHHHGWRAALNDGGWSPPACAANKGQRPVQCHLAGEPYRAHRFAHAASRKKKSPASPKTCGACSATSGGDGGIRTLDPGFGPDAPLAGECLRPLGHVSQTFARTREAVRREEDNIGFRAAGQFL